MTTDRKLETGGKEMEEREKEEEKSNFKNFRKEKTRVSEKEKKWTFLLSVPLILMNKSI